MKRVFIAFALVILCHIAALGQKKYEMVIEKTDGTEVVISTDDIVRTYFREKTESTAPEEAHLLGEFQECGADGTLRDDATDDEVLHLKFYTDGTGYFWSVTKGQKDDHSYNFTYTVNFSGTTGTMVMTITSCPDEPSLVGLTETVSVTYSDGIISYYGEDEIHYKLISGPGF